MFLNIVLKIGLVKGLVNFKIENAKSNEVKRIKKIAFFRVLALSFVSLFVNIFV